MMRYFLLSTSLFFACTGKNENKQIENYQSTFEVKQETVSTSNSKSNSIENNQNERLFSIKSIKTDSGWGYQIFKESKMIINQKTIPAIQGNFSFKSENEALQVGELVLTKIEHGVFPPSITVNELDSLKIKY